MKTIELDYQLMKSARPRLDINDPGISNKVDAIIMAVCRNQMLEKNLLLGNGRHRPYPDARKVVSFMLRKELHLTYYQMANILRRDHSTIVHQVNWIEERKDMLQHYPAIESMLYAAKRALIQGI